jgi:thiosulfate reductase cytochrome b subunit
MRKIIQKHPLPVRITHWLNVVFLSIMIWSGMLIYWSNDIYKVKTGSTTVIKFFPQWFYKLFNIPYRLAEGMSYHFAFMWFFTINGLFYFLFLMFSKEYKLNFPNRRSFKESFQVLLHDLRLRKTAPPHKKYNAAQRMAYTTILVLGLLEIITGLAIYKPVQLNWLCWLLGGYEWARAEHFIITILFILFIIIHVLQVIKAGWNNFRAMVTGFETKKEHKP